MPNIMVGSVRRGRQGLGVKKGGVRAFLGGRRSALDGPTGQLSWSYQAEAAVNSSPAVVDEVVYSTSTKYPAKQAIASAAEVPAKELIQLGTVQDCPAADEGLGEAAHENIGIVA